MVVLLLVLAGAWLYYVGIPLELVERARAEAAKDGIYFEADHVYLDFFEGIVAEGVRWFELEDDIVPALDAGKVIIPLNLKHLREPELLVRGFRVEEGHVSLDVGEKGGLKSHRVDCFDLAFEVSLGRKEVSIRDLRMNFCDFHVRGSGDVVRKNREKRVPSAPDIAGSTKEERRQAQRARHKAQLQPLFAQICKITTELGEVNHREVPEARIYFQIDENDPAANEVTFKLRSDAPCWIRGQRVDRVMVDAVYKKQVIHLNRCWLAQEERQFKMSGMLNVSNEMATAKIESTLNAEALLAFAPKTVLAELERQQVSLKGDVDINVDFPWSRMKDFARHFEGDFSGTWASYNGIELHDGHVHLKRDGQLFEVTEIHADVGRDQQRGPVRGYYKEYRDLGTFELNLDMGFNPTLFDALESTFLSKIVSIMRFEGPPPTVNLFLNGSFGKDESVVCTSRIRGKDAVYQGVKFERVAVDLEILRSVIYLTHIDLQRPEGRVSGVMHKNFAKEQMFLDLKSDVSPEALGKILGPSGERLLQRFSFKEGIDADVHGLLDQGENAKHSLHGKIVVRDATYSTFHVVNSTLFWTLQNNILTLPDFNGTVNGGETRGFAQMMNMNSVSNQVFNLELSLHNADLKEMAVLDSRTKDNPYSGIMNGSIRLNGVVGEASLASLRGSGDISVRKGELFKTAVFGGLSKYLSKLISGVGYATQSDIDCSFTVSNQKVHAKSLKIKGNVFSIDGSGYVGFDEKLSGLFQVKLLKEGLLAEAARIITWPISKLFEFKLGGDMSKPEWRPQNLPKELFLKFD